MSVPPSDAAAPSNSRLIAAQAKSLRGTLLRDRSPDLPISAGEFADAVELIELLANEVADQADRSADRSSTDGSASLDR